MVSRIEIATRLQSLLKCAHMSSRNSNLVSKVRAVVSWPYLRLKRFYYERIVNTWVNRLYSLLLLLVLIGYGLIVLSSYHENTWYASSDKTEIERYPCEHCVKQGLYIKKKREKLNQLLMISNDRLDLFERAISDEKSAFYVDARELYTEEKEVMKGLHHQLDRLLFPPIYKGIGYELAVILILLILSWIASWHVEKDKVKYLIVDDQVSNSYEVKWFGIFGKQSWFNWLSGSVVFVFALNIIRLGLSSILNDSKVWFTQVSYCVSHRNFCIQIVLLLIITIIAMLPLNLVWEYFGVKYYNSLDEEDLKLPKLGRGPYLLFIEKWLTVISAAFFISTIAWLFYVSYWEVAGIMILINSIVGLLMLFAIIVRGFHKFFSVRREYTIAVTNTKVIDDDGNEIKIAEDPTIPILGEYWWKIGIAVVSVIGVLYGVLQFFNLNVGSL